MAKNLKEEAYDGNKNNPPERPPKPNTSQTTDKETEGTKETDEGKNDEKAE